ncbi:MAG: hypothetical protein K2I13_05935, partial [Alistipes sp.]|nr:hypothetical protein [Alistipes sp.]
GLAQPFGGLGFAGLRRVLQLSELREPQPSGAEARNCSPRRLRSLQANKNNDSFPKSAWLSAIHPSLPQSREQFKMHNS